MRKTFNGCVYFLTFVRPDMVLPMASCLSLLRFDNTVVSADSQYANVSNVKPGCAYHRHSFFKGADEDNVANNCIPQALRNACTIFMARGLGGFVVYREDTMVDADSEHGRKSNVRQSYVVCSCESHSILLGADHVWNKTGMLANSMCCTKLCK